MNVCYYIFKNTKFFKNTKTSEVGDLPDGERIITINTNWPIIDGSDFEGPFYNLQGLIKNSKVYADLKKSNPKRATKIIQKEYIDSPEGFMKSPKGREYGFDFIRGFVHSVLGNFKNDEVTGIHFYDAKKIKIVEILESNNKGVWRAKIEALDPRTEKWNIKQKPTDFFPKEWDTSKILDELYFANDNKTLKVGSEKVYEAVTKSGINVVFIIDVGEVKTIYPIL